MTRINVIDPKLLTESHAMAEYRELPMINAALARSLKSKHGIRLDTIPSEYTLNKGHVRHFYNKGKWLFDRYNLLIAELRDRGYNIKPENRVVNWDVFKDNGLFNDWSPNDKAHVINLERIIERINQKRSWYRYRSTPITEEYIALLYQHLHNHQKRIQDKCQL